MCGTTSGVYCTLLMLAPVVARRARVAARIMVCGGSTPGGHTGPRTDAHTTPQHDAHTTPHHTTMRTRVGGWKAGPRAHLHTGEGGGGEAPGEDLVMVLELGDVAHRARLVLQVEVLPAHP